jgi:hypothetical protein
MRRVYISIRLGLNDWLVKRGERLKAAIEARLCLIDHQSERLERVGASMKQRATA